MKKATLKQIIISLLIVLIVSTFVPFVYGQITGDEPDYGSFLARAIVYGIGAYVVQVYFLSDKSKPLK